MDAAESELVDLAEVNRLSLHLVGGKGANLGELLAAGFPVPPGFCVTTVAYRRFVREAGLEKTIAAAVEQLQPEYQRVRDEPGDDSRLTARAAEIGASLRAAFLAAPLPAGLDTAILAAAERVGAGGGSFAVRSSATAEDLPEASFAGQQDTYLNISPGPALLLAIRRCWSSLWTDRAIVYRTRNQVDQRQVGLAVVVQRLILAEAAGVLFTAHPVTGRRSQIVIDASLGLGEAIVSGAVTPDHYVVDKRSGSLLERVINAKQVLAQPVAGGGTALATPTTARQQAPAVEERVILELARLGQRIEDHYRTPQDIEWTYAQGEVAVVQSRPITTLFPIPLLPTIGHAPVEVRFYICLSAVQGMLEPLTPLGFSIFQEVGRIILGATKLPLGPTPPGGWPVPRLFEATLAGQEALHLLAGRVYLDVTRLLRQPGLRTFLLTVLGQADPVTGRALQAAIDSANLPPVPFASRGTLVSLAGRLFPRIWYIPLRLFQALLNPAAAERRIKQGAFPQLERLRNQGLAGLTSPPRDRLRLARLLLQGVFRIFRGYIIPVVAGGAVSTIVVHRLARRWSIGTALIMPLRQGLPHNVTTEMDIALWRLARRIKAEPAAGAALLQGEPAELAGRYLEGTLPEPAQTELAAFLSRYGHRGVREIDVGVPRWADDPTYILGVLQGLIAAERDPASAPDLHFSALQRQAASQLARIQDQLRTQPGGALKAALFGFFTGRMRALFGFRETPKFSAIFVFQVLRTLILSIGEDLAGQGRLDQADDVFFLTLDELEQTAGDDTQFSAAITYTPPDLRACVATRRRQYEREFELRRIPRVLTSDGETFYGRPQIEGGTGLSGVGASPGIVEGRVRVIRNPLGAQLEKGEILVAPSTDPAWTPLFLIAGGLVMEAGGMISHGSVVAREYGIPAVVGVAGATDHLHTGQRVVVDGDLGEVRLLP